MEEDDDPGMGVIKRRRSRRLLEGRKTATAPAQDRITTESAAAAWGDMLVAETPKPPPKAAPKAPDPQPEKPRTDAPRPGLRGVPLSSRPPPAAPPEVLMDEALRGETREAPREQPPKPVQAVRTPDRRPSGPQAIVILPPSNHAPDTGPPARVPPVRESQAPRPPPPLARPSEPPRPLSHPVAALPDERTSRQEDPPKPSENTLELPAMKPPVRKRPLWMDVTLGVLLLAAGVWTGAVLFDDMGRTDRLDRVGRALSTMGQRLVRDHSDLPAWLGPNPDPVAVKSLKEKEIPRLVEAVSAAGYTQGVFSVALIEDPAHSRLVLEARVPDAIVAYGSDGQWVHAPPETGLWAALRSNGTSILASFALPVLGFIGLLVVRNRSRAGADASPRNR